MNKNVTLLHENTQTAAMKFNFYKAQRLTVTRSYVTVYVLDSVTRLFFHSLFHVLLYIALLFRLALFF